MIDFIFENADTFQKKTIKIIIKRAVTQVLKEISFNKDFYLSVLLTNNQGIKKINKRFSSLNKSTNVLSFPYNEIRFFEHKKQKVILGDIVISLEKVLEESGIENKTFTNHLTHMTVHSVLHLFGFTHEKQKDFNIMKNKEVSVLTKLQISSPY
jgi:probable rRNA maturation factor|tara:strand:- start:43 stop:504 length:462 start_codon:yes stop_codon:yes gene_type:complete